ncbi:helix-turn-helix domain-containing protein [Paraflavisolibacter sp. H34]|uniref:helix-turn-helix domain-containing protein n=1 Tax=Huijunlia imazamoxiresistens TaxID=3127457 RepID=UPI00301A8D99
MQHRKYYIRGMVCERCIASVKEALEHLGVEVVAVGLGEVTLAPHAQIPEEQVQERLQSLGFSLLEDKRLRLLKEAKALVAEVYSGSFDFPPGFRFSTLAADRLRVSPDAISTLFSEMEGTTLEKYIIGFRIGKIKELLVYTDRSLADMAFALGFSSVAHLSAQFKSNTGLNPSHFKKIQSSKEAARSRAGGS